MSEQEQDVVALLQKMQQQLVYLEKKIDTLIQQSQQKPFSRPGGNFSRPFRPFGRPGGNRPDGQGRPDRPRSFGHSQGGHGGGGGHFAPKKKPFFGRGKEQR